MARGNLGVKTGKGFYEWTPELEEVLRRRIANALGRDRPLASRRRRRGAN